MPALIYNTLTLTSTYTLRYENPCKYKGFDQLLYFETKKGSSTLLDRLSMLVLVFISSYYMINTFI